MPEKQAWESLENYKLFRDYPSTEAALNDGIPANKIAPYDPKLDQKGWVDPNATEAFTIGDVPMAYYPYCFKGRFGGADGAGIIEPLVITVEFAKRFNFKPVGTGMTNVPGTGVTCPVPLKPLAPTQKLLRRTPFSSFEVRNTDVEDTSGGSVDASFKQTDRDVLYAIARKLGVQI